VRYGIDLADKLIADNRLAPQGPFLELVAAFLDPDNSPPEARFRWHPFIASFCATSDKAVHWLHYGSDGTGAAVGLRSDEIAVTPFELVKVVYDERE
jgi:hypothetical protein